MTELASATFVEIVSTDGAAAFLKANPIPITSQLAELKASAAASSPLSEGSVALGLIGQWQGFALFASSDVLAAVDAKEKAALLDLALGQLKNDQGSKRWKEKGELSELTQMLLETLTPWSKDPVVVDLMSTKTGVLATLKAMLKACKAPRGASLNVLESIVGTVRRCCITTKKRPGNTSTAGFAALKSIGALKMFEECVVRVDEVYEDDESAAAEEKGNLGAESPKTQGGISRPAEASRSRNPTVAVSSAVTPNNTADPPFAPVRLPPLLLLRSCVAFGVTRPAASLASGRVRH